MHLAFRIIVLVLALLGGAGQLVLGLKWRGDALENKEMVALVKLFHKAAREGATTPAEKARLTQVDEKVRQFNRVLNCVPYLLVGGVMAIVGGVIAVVGYPSFGAVWLFLAQVGPAILAPMSMIFSCFLPVSILTCVVACFIPKPDPAARKAQPSRRDRDDDYDDYDDRRGRRDRDDDDDRRRDD